MIIRRAKRIQKEKLNLYLVGMPGSGKSRTAQRLARAIEKPVADTDKLIIDKQGMSIDEIFDTHGEIISSARLKAKLCSALRNAADMLLQPRSGILTVEQNIPIIKGGENRCFEQGYKHTAERKNRQPSLDPRRTRKPCSNFMPNVSKPTANVQILLLIRTAPAASEEFSIIIKE